MRMFIAALGWLVASIALAAPVKGEVLNARFGDIEEALKASPGLVAVHQDVRITEAKGEWAVEGGQSVWRYRLQVPEASSLGLTITQLRLPAGGSLTISGANGSSEILRGSGRDIVTALMPTEEIALTARMPEASGFSILVNGVQVGARELRRPRGAKSLDQKSRPLALAPHPSCTTNPASLTCRESRRRNASCHVDAGNYREARSVVGLVINRPDGTNADGSTRFDAASCSGNLVNDTAGSGKAYITTARHCGLRSGSVRRDATSVVPGTRFKIYWNRRADCGSSAYDLTEFYLLPGPTTENTDIAVRSVSAYVDYNGMASYYTDALLLEATSAIPDGANPYWAGIDARAPTVSHGQVDPSIVNPFSLSHPAGYAASLARSSNPVDYGLAGQDRCRLGNLVSSCNSYSLVFTEGDITEGSSGSGLLDSSKRVRGVASEAADNGTSISTYSGLAFVWSPTQAGSPVSWNFNQFLDAGNTGLRVTDGRNDFGRPDNINVWLGSPQVDQNIGSYTVHYVTDNAVACTASSDPIQAGWNGFRATSNGLDSLSTFTATRDGVQVLSLTCTNAAGRSRTANLFLNGVVGGTPSDQDADGTPDAGDSCPTQSGPASNNGCPLPADTDGDGLPDIRDDCVTQPGPVANGGCPTVNDPDGDGTDGANDFCPNAPGPATNNGCPVTAPDDQDGDGVRDSDDRCPLSYGPATNNGCPVTGPDLSYDPGKRSGGSLSLGLLLSLILLGVCGKLSRRRF